MDSTELAKSVFDGQSLIKLVLDSQLLGFLLGLSASLFFYWRSRRDTRELQGNIWKKEFDRYQTEPLVSIFREIILFFETNSTSTIKSLIRQDILTKLKIEIQLIRYLGEELKEKINKEIYHECLMYNKSIIGESVQQTKTDKASDVIIANENKIEKEKRESIQKAIAEVIDKLKSVYSKY